MRNIKLISIFLIILSLIFIGCVQKPDRTSVVTPGGPTDTKVIDSPLPTATVKAPAFYKVFVDDTGFYKVRDVNNSPIKYENQTLNIYVGDTVAWFSEIDYGRITIVSEQDLWEKNDTRAILISRGFNYTFISPGMYTFSIKEEPRAPKQKIIVNQ
ncbi:MAG: hypothetical protein O8C58_01265 [Candidatus Methanoperedens sp.]|nr:hypothetical protein [Candidatus Methanoperedens sp.]